VQIFASSVNFGIGFFAHVRDSNWIRTVICQNHVTAFTFISVSSFNFAIYVAKSTIYLAQLRA